MKLENNFKDLAKEMAKNYEYAITNEELEEIYDYFFNQEDGIINHLLSSKIKDLAYSKDLEKTQDMELSQ